MSSQPVCTAPQCGKGGLVSVLGGKEGGKENREAGLEARWPPMTFQPDPQGGRPAAVLPARAAVPEGTSGGVGLFLYPSLLSPQNPSTAAEPEDGGSCTAPTAISSRPSALTG